MYIQRLLNSPVRGKELFEIIRDEASNTSQAIITIADLKLSETAIQVLNKVSNLVTEPDLKKLIQQTEPINVAFQNYLIPSEKDVFPDVIKYLLTINKLNQLAVDKIFFTEITNKANQFIDCEKDGLRLTSDNKVRNVIAKLSKMGKLVEDKLTLQQDIVTLGKKEIAFDLVETIGFLEVFDPKKVEVKYDYKSTRDYTFANSSSTNVDLTTNPTVQTLLNQFLSYPQNHYKEKINGNILYNDAQLNPNDHLKQLNIDLSHNHAFKLIIDDGFREIDRVDCYKNTSRIVTSPGNQQKEFSINYNIIYEQLEKNFSIAKETLIGMNSTLKEILEGANILTNTTYARQIQYENTDKQMKDIDYNLPINEVNELAHIFNDSNSTNSLNFTIRLRFRGNILLRNPAYLAKIQSKIQQYGSVISTLNQESIKCGAVIAALPLKETEKSELFNDKIFSDDNLVLEALLIMLENMR